MVHSCLMHALRAITAALFLSPLCLAAPTEAELKAARKLFEQAQEHEAARRWLDALGLLERILLVKETAGVRFHVAVCREHLGQLVEAEADYRRAAELATQMKSREGDAIVAQASDALVALKPRIPLLTLKLPELPGLQISLDDTPLPAERAQRPIPRNPGPVQLRASAPGHKDFTLSLALPEGTQQRADIALQPLQPPPDASAPPPAASAPPPAPPPRRWPALVVGGASLAAAGTGAFFFLQHRRLDRETTSICNDPEYQCDRSGRNARLADYQRYGLVAGGIALVGLGAATYLWVSSSPQGARTTLWIGPDQVGVAGRW